MLKRCGAVIDNLKQYVPLVNTSFPNKQHLNNQTYILSCIISLHKKMLAANVPEKCHCPQPCIEIKYDIIEVPEKRETCEWAPLLTRCPNDPRGTFACNAVHIKIQYRTNKFEYVKEVAAYSLPTLAADIGSTVGSLAGISVLSVVELLVFISISLIVFFV